ncbi:histidine kinase N-terminal domain-containing protein [Anoxybacteroides amylolyticum]|uniref:histidine kinase n=1 Tax=Anoxybacteroides amylolyticum TaxID=294699 RepID=A0A167TAL0_9BACL|nr:histidine kinase N-terminal domain-containing protein [Anoxybacillus amylolyticus]ANB59790.1 his Kinase A domain protein [Anoxybacillus amylolyticus]
MESSREKLSAFLEKHLHDFLTHWRRHMYISEDDKYINHIEQNGIAVFQLVKEALEGSLQPSEIQALAEKVAKQRAEANINMGEFVYNTNFGRSLVIRYALKSGLPIEDLQLLVDDINYLFDQFLFYAITKYTELKNAEIQEKNLFISQSHKDRLTLLGQMSSSFVHEFRNPLTAIMGFVQLLKFEHPNLKYLDIIDHELQQLKFRISQFLHASRKETKEQQKGVIFLEQLLEEIIAFLYPSFVEADVEISSSIDPEASVYGFKDQLKQVFMNILLNSIEAVKEKDKPRQIYIRVSANQEHVHVVISNNGPMIPKETVQAIFEPFFTTKKLGTGIGLYVCKKIIEDHDGQITCTSSEQLTSFAISLPLKKENSLPV